MPSSEAKRICVVGAGRWGRNHLRTLDSLGYLGGFVEPDSDRRSELGLIYPKADSFEHLSEALDASFDGFTVATPATTHYEIARTILERGRPVLVEKPLALTSEHARQLELLAKRSDVPLMVGHLMLFHPAIQKMKELISEGKLGKVEYLYSNRLNLGTVRTEENILWSFAPHDISIFQYFVGRMPEQVSSHGGAFLQPRLQDTTLTFLSYSGNVVGHIFVSWLHPFKEHRLVVIGSKGMLSFEDSSRDKHLYFYEKGIDWVQGAPTKRDGPTEIVPYGSESPLTAELAYFADHLQGGIEICTAESGLEVLTILEQASESLGGEPAEPVHPPADKPHFVHPSSFVDKDVAIGKGTRIWHFSHVQSHAAIGENCSLGQNVNIGSNVKIGNHVKIQNNVSVYEGVELEDYVFCGPSMVFTNVIDPRSKYPQRGSEFYRPTLVKEGASIGANATVVCGHTIGRHAFIGAGAVVTEDVPDFALMLGVPARQAGWVCECGKRLADADGPIECPSCQRPYLLSDGVLSTR